MAKEDKEDQGFRVTDKRLFHDDAGTEEKATSAETEKAPRTEPSKAEAAGAPPEPEEARIDFPSYVLSYYTQGLVLLGEVPNPFNNKKEEDVEGAHHMIDILAMLQEKTKGNLTVEEGQLLDNVLYELRMKFMAKTKRIKL